MSEKAEKLNKLARDVLILSRNTLLVNLRFLDAALSQFAFFPIEESTLLTDGKHILYNPRHILENYKIAKEIPVRDYLHIVMHCVFRHMYMDPSLNRPYWDLACDIAVENVITELGLKAVTASRERQQAQYIAAIRKELKHVTAEKIYSYLRQTVPDPNKIAEIRGLFYADNHEIWYMTGQEIKMRFGLSSGSGEEENGTESCAVMAAVWTGISERMQVDLETFGKQRGLLPGAMTQNLQAVNREKYDYTSFLKKFAVMGEAILTYLDIKKSDFYKIETTVDGKSFVTARGWSDLSDMMKLYEQHGITIDEKLVAQYLQNKKIAKEFAIYYDLFNKYKSDYQVDKILGGKVPAEIKDRAKVAKFDERLALLGLLLDAITGELKKVNLSEQALTELLNSLKNVRMELARPKAEPITAVQKQTGNLEKKIQSGKLASTMSADNEYACRSAMAALEEMTAMLKEKTPADGTEAFKLLKAEFDNRTKSLKKQADSAGKQLSNVFLFCEEVFAEDQEMLILVTELTISYYSARFISRYGCKEYFNHNKELLFYERQKEIIRELESLDLGGLNDE